MADYEFVVAAIGWIARETMLFAAIGFAIGGVDDVCVDLVFVARAVVRRWRGATAIELTLEELGLRQTRGRLVVFVAAWDESAVIGAMLRTALARYDHPDYRIYVGAYPNDRPTIDAVAVVAGEDCRIRLIVGERPGPTTKADCLNTLWRALVVDERAEHFTAAAIMLHDAEDLVHPGELRVVDHFLRQADVIQLPVLPLVDRRSRLVSGHYLDEFAESHGKQLLVRQALGAAMPLAGVGCAIARPMLGRVADARGGVPFDAESLTEDYELGLTLGAMGARMRFARVAEFAGGPPVAVRAFFPADLRAAVRQKARWMTGIALAGWDRTGWARPLDLGDHWMRMRDRRAVLAVVVLAAAYLALIAWGALLIAQWIGVAAMIDPSPAMMLLLKLNAGLLLWRLFMRAAFVWPGYGATEALLSIPRMVVANLISLMAARHAIGRYIGMLRGQAVRWDKTAHHFPDLPSKSHQ